MANKKKIFIVLSIVVLILVTIIIFFTQVYFITLFSKLDIKWSSLSSNTIRGRIIDQDGQPYKSYRVKYTDTSDHNTVYTNSQGYFEFDFSDLLYELRIGNHEVMINRVYRPLMSKGAEMTVIIVREE